MENTMYVAGAVLLTLVGLIHSVLGEVLIFSRMRTEGVVPTNGGSVLRERHVRILWATWHVVTVLAFSGGGSHLESDIVAFGGTRRGLDGGDCRRRIAGEFGTGRNRNPSTASRLGRAVGGCGLGGPGHLCAVRRAPLKPHLSRLHHRTPPTTDWRTSAQVWVPCCARRTALRPTPAWR